MKKLTYILLSLCLLVNFTSCDVDNYGEPEETFRGAFIDKETKEPFQTAIGNTGIRIRMMEYSWSDTPEPYDLIVCRMVLSRIPKYLQAIMVLFLKVLLYHWMKRLLI